MHKVKHVLMGLMSVMVVVSMGSAGARDLTEEEECTIAKLQATWKNQKCLVKGQIKGIRRGLSGDELNVFGKRHVLKWRRRSVAGFYSGYTVNTAQFPKVPHSFIFYEDGNLAVSAAPFAAADLPGVSLADTAFGEWTEVGSRGDVTWVEFFVRDFVIDANGTIIPNCDGGGCSVITVGKLQIDSHGKLTGSADAIAVDTDNNKLGTATDIFKGLEYVAHRETVADAKRIFDR